MKTEITQLTSTFAESLVAIRIKDETYSVQIADACKADGTTAISWEKKELAASTEDIFYRETLKSSKDA